MDFRLFKDNMVYTDEKTFEKISSLLEEYENLKNEVKEIRAEFGLRTNKKE